MRKLVGRDKDSETSYQLLLWAKLSLGKISLWSVTRDLGSEK